MTRRWSPERETGWRTFCAALSRMGHALQARKRAGGGYEPKRAKRHPLIELVLGDAQIRDAIGEVVPGLEKRKSVLSWVSLGAQAGGGVTVRLNHTGTKERCERGLSALIDALRRAGHRVVFHDMLRHQDQNGYSMVARVREATLAPALGFAR